MDCAAVRQCGNAEVRGSAAVSGSASGSVHTVCTIVCTQCVQQCAAVRLIVCAQCAWQSTAVRLVVYGSARGSMWLCGSVWQCAAVRVAVCVQYAQQCAAVCGCVAECDMNVQYKPSYVNMIIIKYDLTCSYMDAYDFI
jgi:hypothetical protein